MKRSRWSKVRGGFFVAMFAFSIVGVGWAEVPAQEDFGLKGATLLEFIESSGQQWIDTGFYVTEKSGFDLDAICFNPIANPGFACVMGAEHTGGRAYWWLGTYPHYDSGGFDYAGTGQIHYNGGFITGERVFTSFRNGQIVYDPSLRLLPQLTAPDSFQSSGTLGVFADKNDQTGAKENSRTRLYGLKLYEGDVVVRDYVPCRDSNGVACLYDCVNGNFFTLSRNFKIFCNLFIKLICCKMNK